VSAGGTRAVDWPRLATTLEADGFVVTPPLLGPAECARLARLFDDDARFRQTIDMGRHRFGEGCYRYFAEPLPPAVARLRATAYAHLAPVANAWARALGDAPDFPPTLTAFRAHCAANGQRRPTPLLLRYRAGGYNNLHQDLYGDVVFPLQMTIMLSRPGREFTGGAFLLVEQRPRMQSRGHAIDLAQGAAIVFPCRERPAAGKRGAYRVGVRHGVSTIDRGTRTTLGIIFHDAR
jgi:hypothetical protein